ncbi:MAG: radical SAM protein, partial [Sandaracinaceae bacterium]|nr:radical SAM protein [Sandaracinaceae bacterium]
MRSRATPIYNQACRATGPATSTLASSARCCASWEPRWTPRSERATLAPVTSRPTSLRGPDPLSPDERERLLEQARPRSLPIAPDALPAKRKLPLLGPRAKDARYRPIYAVWEITLACDLACRHCGSRAGRDRPDELTTGECLDLVDQMADLGVQEVSLIGGEAYLREDWLEVVRRIRQRGMISLLTTGGR